MKRIDFPQWASSLHTLFPGTEKNFINHQYIGSFGGSRISQKEYEFAKKLGTIIVNEAIQSGLDPGLLTGGGPGSMEAFGVGAKAHTHGNRTPFVGITEKIISDSEQPNDSLDLQLIAPDMSIRKKFLIYIPELLLQFAGALGTFEELIVTLKQENHTPYIWCGIPGFGMELMQMKQEFLYTVIGEEKVNSNFVFDMGKSVEKIAADVVKSLSNSTGRHIASEMPKKALHTYAPDKPIVLELDKDMNIGDRLQCLRLVFGYAVDLTVRYPKWNGEITVKGDTQFISPLKALIERMVIENRVWNPEKLNKMKFVW